MKIAVRRASLGSCAALVLVTFAGIAGREESSQEPVSIAPKHEVAYLPGHTTSWENVLAAAAR